MKLELDSKMLYYGLGGASEWREEGIINFLDDGMLLRATDPGDAGVYSMLIPADSMEVYEPEGMDELGFNFTKILPFIGKNDGEITLEVDANEGEVVKVILTVGSREYTVPAVETEYISGSPDRVPEVDHAFVAEMDWGFISSFIGDFHKFKSNGGGVYFSVQNGVFWLWANDDDNEIKDSLQLEDTGLIELDYSKAYLNDDVDIDPRESEELHNLMSKDILNDLNVNTDKVRFCFDHYAPIKIVSEHDSGLKQSWIITPRIPTQNNYRKIPESVITRRSVLD